jgi:hypothetical protein
MIPGFPLLMLILLSFGLMLGVVKPKRIGTFLLWLIFGPVLIGFAVNMGKQLFWNLSPLGQVLSIILAALVAMVLLLRFALPKGISEALIAAFIHDLLKWMVMLPLNVLGSMVRLITRALRPRRYI